MVVLLNLANKHAQVLALLAVELNRLQSTPAGSPLAEHYTKRRDALLELALTYGVPIDQLVRVLDSFAPNPRALIHGAITRIKERRRRGGRERG